jgi:hypothetical protein
MKLMNQILAQEPHEPQAAQRVESRSAVDARNVNLGDPGAMANVCSPSQLHLFRSSCRRFSSQFTRVQPILLGFSKSSSSLYSAARLAPFFAYMLQKDTLVLFQAQEDRQEDRHQEQQRQREDRRRRCGPPCGCSASERRVEGDWCH